MTWSTEVVQERTGIAGADRDEGTDEGTRAPMSRERDEYSAVALAVVNLGRCAHLVARAVWEVLSVLWISLVLTLSVIVVGIPLVPGTLRLVRRNTHAQRALAARYTGTQTRESYLPFPDRPGLGGALATTRSRLTDPASWRDLGWHLANPLVGGLLAAVPLVAVLDGLWGIYLVFGWRSLVAAAGDWSFGFIPLTSPTMAGLAGLVGLAQLVLGLVLAGPVVALHGGWVRVMLSHRNHRELQERVQQLQSTRRDAVDLQAAEIRRIERDLHDGAQARLVAMGMTLTAVERLLASDPEKARQLVAAVKADSSAALADIRDIVRGIHPPVLADRGLVDAVRALAAASPLQVRISSQLDHRLIPAVESAVYFAVSELLTNAAKHAGASAATVDLQVVGPELQVAVTDDGAGGATLRPGGGLAGLVRRLSIFDGSLAVDSPVGGPTRILLTVPDAEAGDQ